MLTFCSRQRTVPARRHLSVTQIFIVSLLAIVLVAATFVVDTVASRARHLARGAQQLQYASRMLAMHAARSFDGIEILLDELEPQLAQVKHGQHWSPQQGNDFLKKHVTRVLPQVRNLIIFNADGEQRFASLGPPPLPINVKDRPYFIQLRDGAERTRYGPYINRSTQQATYAVARRLALADSSFSGVLLAAAEPDYFEEFCWSSRPFAQFESALVNAEGRIISQCRSPAERPQLKNIGEDYRAALAGGAFAGKIPVAHTGRADTDDFVLHAETLPGYPDLRVISSTPKTLLLAQWQNHLQRSLLLGGAALLALGVAGWLVWRQIRQVSRSNTQLRRHTDKLESRVGDVTVELDRRRQDAQHVGLAKSRFLAAASHDLRQPMQALHLFVGELQRNPGGAQQAILLQRIQQATDAMSQQLEDMIVLSRLDMAGIEVQWENLPMNTVFRQLATIYQPLAEAHGVRLIFLPRETRVHSDAILLRSLLGKLIDNAIKFSPQGTVLVCARRDAAGSTRVEVRDNGPGVAEENQRTIYEEFFQIGNAARQSHAGLGLGLSIVSRLARLLDTPLTLRSRPGAGSTFSLVLPAASTSPESPAPASQAMPRLLLIGSDGENARSLTTQAAEWGYCIESVDDADAARPILTRGGCIAVVFSDDHCVICDRLHALLHDYPGIVIHPPGCPVSGLGPYHLVKPVKPARLRALLRSLH